MRPRHIAAVALVLGLTLAGFIGARELAERDARHDSQHRVDVAAAQIRSRVAEAASLTSSLQRFMLDAGGIGVTSDQFARNVLRWLSPADFPAAAWAENVRAAERGAYERRTGQPIVRPGEQREKVPPRSSYLPATLVSGFPPMNLRGVDLERAPGLAAALRRAIRPGGVGATPVARQGDGTRGFFLVAPAPNLIEGVLRPGAVVVFVSETTLRSAARNPAGLRLGAAGGPSGDAAGGEVVRDEFTVAGQRFAVVMPKESVSGPGEILPWLILAAGLVLAALAVALGVNAARRAKAQADLDRLFNLSPDLIAVADFEGHFTRVNPAVEQVLGYTKEEFLARPYLDLVHPEDREQTAAEASAIGEGKTTRSFENRYVCKDGSSRVLEWTSTPVVEDGLMYGMARDVTERRQAEAEVKRLADEQAALRRVATVVARGGSRSQVFNAIAEEVRQLIGADFIDLLRYDDDRTAVSVASGGTAEEAFAVGSRHELGGNNATSRILRTGQPVRIDDYDRTATGPIAETARTTGIRSVVGTPVVVDDRLWGAVTIGTTGEAPLPSDTESRLDQFTELMSTAIANAEARAEVERLAEEQAALRRVATLVAEGAPPAAVFDAVAAEMEGLLGADGVRLSRYEPAEEVTVVAHRGVNAARVPPGTRVRHSGENVTSIVRRTKRPARLEHYEGTQGPIAELVRDLGVRASVGAPIIVDGQLWGCTIANWRGEQSPPADTEERMTKFAPLLDTAIANADSRDQLTASRARLVTAGDEARRRVVRDLHDGAQQRLVHTIVTLKLAQRALREGDGKGESVVGEALGHAQKANAELRELAHGIHPTVLTRGGLRAGVDAVVTRLDLPVAVDLPSERFAEEIEASAYFIVAEALTNVVKHAHANRAEVRAFVEDGMLHIEVRDDGVGGADSGGHGLVGLEDRATALGGRLKIESPAGDGTLVAATLPLSAG